MNCLNFLGFVMITWIVMQRKLNSSMMLYNLKSMIII